MCRCVTPYIRAFNVNFFCTARLFSSITHCLCDPLYDSASLLFTKIFVHRVENAEVGCYIFSREITNSTGKTKTVNLSFSYKTVLLREHKRRTARRVANARYAVPVEVPPTPAMMDKVKTLVSVILRMRAVTREEQGRDSGT